jgi:hypothetical protein
MEEEARGNYFSITYSRSPLMETVRRTIEERVKSWLPIEYDAYYYKTFVSIILHIGIIEFCRIEIFWDAEPYNIGAIFRDYKPVIIEYGSFCEMVNDLDETLDSIGVDVLPGRHGSSESIHLMFGGDKYSILDGNVSCERWN